MNRKDEEKDRLCSRRSSKLDLKMATVTRLPAKKKIQVCLGGCKEVDGDEKDANHPSMLDSLPLDLKMAILTRVPSKSLMNVKLVSKMYYSIIRSQRFIKSFSSMSSTQSRFIVALYNSHCDNKLIFIFSFSHEGGGESSSLVPNLEMVIPSVSFSLYSSCQSVHGILLLQAECQLILCNPSTEQAITVPPRPVILFGYDPIGDQHKLVFGRSLFPHHELPREHKVLTLGGGQGWRRIQVDFDYTGASSSRGICVNGFVYLSAYSPKQPMNPGFVCFDVRSEKVSYIKAPEAVLRGCGIHPLIFIEYNGKLASIAKPRYHGFQSFSIWILEDVETHQWSHQKCVIPLSVWESFGPGIPMCFPGTNKYGELILAPMYLSLIINKPFYIFYYNVETKNCTRVRLLGIGDDEEFLRTYGFRDIPCFQPHVRIAPHHMESIATFKDPPTIFQHF